MMKKLAVLASVVAAIAVARPALAQGPFADVPTDHWAYDAVNELAKQGIVNGYPDSTFGGKRALTRYEFAMAIQRMLQEVQRRIDTAVHGITPGTTGPSREDIQGMIDERLKNVPTREEVDRLRSLWQIGSVVVPYLGIWVLAAAVQPGPWGAIALDLAATVFLMRMYSLYHDLNHNSMFRSRLANRLNSHLLGSTVVRRQYVDQRSRARCVQGLRR